MAKDYHDILNRKTTMDKVGDAFTDQANSMRPMNVGQRREQALMRGLGAGFGLNPAREAKLAELENMSKELSMNKYALEMQSGKNELTKQKNLAFFNENQAALSQLSEYIYAGKHSEVDMLAPEILKSYGDITGNKIGKFNHYKNGYATFIDDSGEPKTINIKNLIQPVMDLLPPDQKKEYRGFLSPLQNADIDRMVKAQELQMEKYQADIEASRASAELHRSQGYKARNEMGELEKLQYKNQLDKNSEEYKTKLKVNNDYIEGLSKENTRANNIIPILDEFNKLLTSSPELFGSGKWMEAKRAIAKFTGDDAPIQRANYLQKYFFPEIKGIAGNPNQREWGDLVGKIISESQNVGAALSQIQLDKKILQGKQREFNNYSKVLSGTDHNYYYYDPEITSRIKRMEKENVDMVETIDTDGNIIKVPKQ